MADFSIDLRINDQAARSQLQSFKTHAEKQLALDAKSSAISSLETILAKARNEASQLGKELRNAKLENADPGKIADLTRQLNGARDSVSALSNRSKELRSELSNIRQTPIEIGGLNGFVNKFVEATQQASIFGQGMQVVQTNIQNAADMMNRFSEQAKAAFINYDSAVTKVSTLSTDEQAQELAGNLKNLTGELKNQINTTDALNASYDILSSGFTTNSDITQVLVASQKSAQGGFSNVETTANALTTILKSYNLEASEATRVADQMAQTQNFGKITIDQYARFIGRLASTAAQAGVSLEEMNAYIATATLKGVRPSTAIDGLRQAIAAVLKPSHEAIDLARSLGVSFDATALKTTGLKGVLGELAAKGYATPEMLTKLFGSVEAVAAILPSLGPGAKDFEKNLEGIANSAGTVDITANKVANSFQGRITQAMNIANEALVSIGSGVGRAIAPLIGALNFLIGAFNSLPAPIKEGVGVMIALSGGALTVTAALAGMMAILPMIRALWIQVNAAGMAWSVVQKLSALSTGLSTAAIGADTAARTANVTTIRMGSAALSQNVSVMAGAATTLGVMAAAAAVWALVYQQAFGNTKDIQAQSDALKEYENTMSKLAEQEISKTGKESGSNNVIPDNTDQAIAKITSELNIAQQAIDFLIIKFREFGSFILNMLGPVGAAINLFGKQIENLTGFKFSTKAEQQLSKQQADFYEIIQKSEQALQKFDGKDIGSMGLSPEDLAKEQEAIKANLTLLEKSKPATEADAAAKATYKKALEATKAKLDAYANSQKESNAESEKTPQAAVKQKEALDKVGEAADIAAKRQEIASKQALTKIEEDLNKGIITQADAEKKRSEVEMKGADDRLKAIKQQQDQIAALKETTTDPATLKDLAKKELDLDGQLAEAKLAKAKMITDAKKRENERQLKDLEEANAKAKTLIDIESNNRSIAIKKAQLGGLSPEKAAEKQATADIDSGKAKVAQLEKEKAQVDAMRAKGLIDDKEAGKRKLEIEKQIGSEQLSLLDKLIAQKEARRQKEIKKIQDEQKKLEQLAKINTTKQTLDVKTQQLSGGLGEKQAKNQLEKIEIDASKTTVNLAARELTKLDEMRDRGLIKSKEYAEKRRELEQKLLDAKVSLVDKELAVKERLKQESIAKIEAEGAAKQAALNNQSGQLDLQSSGLSQTKNLSDARANLGNALAKANQQPFQFAVDTAKTEEEKLLATQRLITAKNASLEESQYWEQQSLAITQQQAILDAERQKITADIALLEAEIALQKLKASGASEKEIQAAEKVLDLRKKQVGMAESNIANVGEINKLQTQTLAVTQNTDRQSLQFEAAKSGIVTDGQSARIGDGVLDEARTKDLEAATKNTEAADKNLAASNNNLKAADKNESITKLANGTEIEKRGTTSIFRSGKTFNQDELDKFEANQITPEKIAAQRKAEREALEKGGATANVARNVALMQRDSTPITQTLPQVQQQFSNLAPKLPDNFSQQISLPSTNESSKLTAVIENQIVTSLNNLTSEIRAALQSPRSVTVNGSQDPGNDAVNLVKELANQTNSNRR